MCKVVRELTARELIEQSNCENKELILKRLKEEDFRLHERLNSHEEEIHRQRNIIESYRTVLKDMIYSNCLNH